MVHVRQHAFTNADRIFDYIICGGGTSGCVVAGRLAEDPLVSVLLIEAGEHIDKVPAAQMPGGAWEIVNSTADFNIVDDLGEAMNHRQVRLSRGKVLGGSSTCNGTLCVRGTKTDYDRWNLKGWSGDEVFEYMSKAETFHPKSWFKANTKAHGTSGPLHTEPHDLAPISELLIQSYESQGIPLEPDMFTTGNISHGCGHAVRTVSAGLRTTAADYVTKSHSRKNLTILTNSTVEKFRLEKQGNAFNASGVQVITNGQPMEIYEARREIIISAGAYCSPPILLRSGIGAKMDVEKHGINSLVDLPGVGKNLQDHLIVFTFYESSEPKLTTDHLIYHGDAHPQALDLWKFSKTGFLSSFPFGSFAFARLDDRLMDSPLWRNSPREPGCDPMGLTPQQPNIEFFNTECYGGPPHLFNEYPLDGQSTFSVLTELFAPRSRGTVQLKSADPAVNPVVENNYLSDPLDILVLAEGCRLGNEIVMEGSGTKGVIKGAWPEDLMHHEYTTREQWIEFVKDQAVTCYHPGGTCKMGQKDDPLAVLDAELRVRGVSNLRVADVSVMPTLNNGHTQMPAYAIGEKAADMIKAAWKAPTNGHY